MNWKRFTRLACSILLLIPIGKLLYACTDGPDPYDYFTSFFLDDVNKDPALIPFHYTTQAVYYDDWYSFRDSDALTMPDANLAEWKAYAGKPFSDADAAAFVYQYPYKDLSNLYSSVEKNAPLQISKAAQANSFTKWLQESRDLEALGYLMYAKQCEPLVAGGGDDWQQPERDTAKMGKLLRNGLQLHAAAKQEFFRWRYAFQVIRLAFYSNNYPRTLRLYQDLIGDKTGAGIMYARCLGLKAGALFRTRQTGEAAYLYSRVFDLSDEMKRKAYISFNWAIGDSTEAALPLCKNDHERAVVYVMDGLYHYEAEGNDGVALIQSAYEADPAVKGLDLVMTREINRLEDTYLTRLLLEGRHVDGMYSFGGGDEKQGDFWDEEQRKQTAYAKQLAALAGKIAAGKKNATSAYWQLAAAYLEFIARDPAAMKAALDKTSGMAMTERQKDQKGIAEALYYIVQRPKTDAEAEAQVLASLQWLDGRRAKDWRLDKAYKYLLSSVLTTAYLQQHDTVKSVLALSKLKDAEVAGVRRYSDDYSYEYLENFGDEAGTMLQQMSIPALRQVKAFVAGGHKTPFESWLTQHNMYTPSVLSEVEGTRFIRQMDWEEAVAALGQVNKPELKYRPIRNAFTMQSPEMQEWNKQDSAGSSDKLAFAREMKRLRDVTLKNPGDAASLFRYGLGLYAITYYGRASHAYTYYRSGSDEHAYFQGSERKNLNAEDLNYYTCAAALEVFQKAFAAAGADAELKAKSAYLAALCWQKSCPEPPTGAVSYLDEETEEFYRQNSLRNPYFKTLQDYKATGYYRQVSGECAYLRDYVNRLR